MSDIAESGTRFNEKDVREKKNFRVIYPVDFN